MSTLNKKHSKSTQKGQVENLAEIESLTNNTANSTIISSTPTFFKENFTRFECKECPEKKPQLMLENLELYSSDGYAEVLKRLFKQHGGQERCKKVGGGRVRFLSEDDDNELEFYTEKASRLMEQSIRRENENLESLKETNTALKRLICRVIATQQIKFADVVDAGGAKSMSGLHRTILKEFFGEESTQRESTRPRRSARVAIKSIRHKDLKTEQEEKKPVKTTPEQEINTSKTSGASQPCEWGYIPIIKVDSLANLDLKSKTESGTNPFSKSIQGPGSGVKAPNLASEGSSGKDDLTFEKSPTFSRKLFSNKKRRGTASDAIRIDSCMTIESTVPKYFAELECSEILGLSSVNKENRDPNSAGSPLVGKHVSKVPEESIEVAKQDKTALRITSKGCGPDLLMTSLELNRHLSNPAKEDRENKETDSGNLKTLKSLLSSMNSGCSKLNNSGERGCNLAYGYLSNSSRVTRRQSSPSASSIYRDLVKLNKNKKSEKKEKSPIKLT